MADNMATQNQFPGYAKLPRKKEFRTKVRLDFNGRINSGPDGAKLNGFSLRLFTPKEKPSDQKSEIGVYLRPEEWLDLIDAMKEVFEKYSQARSDLEGPRS